MPVIDVEGTPATVNFDYSDLLAQRTYKVLYGGNQYCAVGCTATSYALTSYVFNSHSQQTLADGNTGGTYAKTVDCDFDLGFKTTQVIEGTGIINFTSGVNDASYTKARVILKKVEDSTETTLVTSSYGNVIHSAAGPSSYANCFFITIPETKFRKGDKLRITAEVWNKNAAGADLRVFLAHDPANRNGCTYIEDANTKQFTAWIPFRPIL